ncbi:MAG: hypothetical protein RL637_415 [Pseudomonadota bacterium]|jgi:hypothetical protein
MKWLLISLLSLWIGCPFAAETKAETEWENTTLSDVLIKNVQQIQHEYRQCVAHELAKPDYAKADIYTAPEKILKICEPMLAKIRNLYLENKVPEVIADRQLKQLRIQTTRNIISELMFRAAQAPEK